MISIKSKNVHGATDTKIKVRGKAVEVVVEALSIYKSFTNTLKASSPEAYDMLLRAIRDLEEKEAVEAAIEKEEANGELDK